MVQCEIEERQEGTSENSVESLEKAGKIRKRSLSSAYAIMSKPASEKASDRGEQ